MKKKFLFLGFAIPDEEMELVFEKDQLPQIQTHKFNWNLIKAIEYCDKHEYTYISARPINDFPYYPIKKIKKKNWEVILKKKKICITEIPFYNKSILKIITRFISSLFYGTKNYHCCNNKGGVIVYSVHVPFMLTGYILSKLYNVNLIAIWTDPPSVLREKDSKLKTKLRNIELRLSKFLMKRADKIVALTKYLAEDFAPNKPYLVIEGIIDEDDAPISEVKTYNHLSAYSKNGRKPVKFVYTGSLEKRYGIKNIVDGFSLLSDYNCVLEIYGRGDFEVELQTVYNKNFKIHYKGFVSNKEIMKIQRAADFLINARSPNEEFVKYSFPSKTLEYMLSGTPLITTMLPGIPDEYKEHVIILEDNSPETIARVVLNIMSIDNNTLQKLGVDAQLFALSRKYQVQGRRILDFISS